MCVAYVLLEKDMNNEYEFPFPKLSKIKYFTFYQMKIYI